MGISCSDNHRSNYNHRFHLQLIYRYNRGICRLLYESELRRENIYSPYGIHASHSEQIMHYFFRKINRKKTHCMNLIVYFTKTNREKKILISASACSSCRRWQRNWSRLQVRRSTMRLRVASRPFDVHNDIDDFCVDGLGPWCKGRWL